MIEKKRTATYLAYMLRLWREGDHSSWRASLEDPHTGERRAFATLHNLIDFLETQMGLPSCSVEGERSPDDPPAEAQ